MLLAIDFAAHLIEPQIEQRILLFDLSLELLEMKTVVLLKIKLNQIARIKSVLMLKNLNYSSIIGHMLMVMSNLNTN